MLAPKKCRKGEGLKSEGQPKGVVCTYGDVAKFLGEEPEGWGKNLRGPTRKKPGGKVGLRKPRKAGPRDERRQKGNGRRR